MKNYEIIESDLGASFIVETLQDGATRWIPSDPANSDYQRYLRWLENPDAEEGGTL